MRRIAALLSLLAALLPAVAFAQAPPPVPALPDTARLTSYSISNQTGPFSVGFALYGDGTDYGDWIEVRLCTSATLNPCTSLTAVTQWTLSSATGSLATIPRPITDATITLVTAQTGTLTINGARRPRRLSQFPENRGVAARDLNQVITDLVAENRENWDRVARTIRGQPGEVVQPMQPAATRASGFLCWDATGLIPQTCAALTGLGNVIGPNVSVIGHIATFGNTAGTILTDGGLIGSGNMVGPNSSTINHAATFKDSGGVNIIDSGLTLTPSTGTVTITNAKTLAVTNSLTLSGSDSTTITFQGTDTYVGRATTDTLTNKTYDTAGTGNVFKINGTAVSAVTGTGSAVLSTSPTLVTPTLGVATVTTVNKVTITAPATGSTLTIADGKTFTASNTLTLAGTDGKTLTVSNSGTLAGGDGFTLAVAANKTLTASNSLTLAGTDGKTLTVSNSGTLGGGDGFTLAIAANKTLTVSNSLAFTGTDSTSFAFPTSSDTVVGTGATQTLAAKTLTAPTINGGTAQALTNLGIRSSGSGAFDLVIANTENLTAQRTLTVTTNNANRTLNMSGNLTLAAGFTTAGGNAITLTAGGTSNVNVPASGTLATNDVGQTFSAANTFSALQQFTSIKLSSGLIYPTADGTSALQITKADGVTAIATIDTTNRRIGINKAPGAFDLDINGAVNIGGTVSFGTLSAASLAASPTTYTGLVHNASPAVGSDYVSFASSANNAINKITISELISAATAGVQTLNGLSGNVVIGQVVSASGTAITLPVARPAGRLTLQSATPVMTASQTAKTTLFYDVYQGGNTVPYYTGSTDNIDTIAGAEVSTAMASSGSGTLSAANVFDVWWEGNTNHNICIATNNSGGGWASDTGGSNTARGTGYSQLDTTSRPYITNKNSVSHCFNGATDYGSILANKLTYLGTICTDSGAAGSVSYTFGAAASGGTAGRLCVWNAYNRKLVASASQDSKASWNYTTATIRQADGSTGNQTIAVIGVSEDTVEATYNIIFGNTNAGVSAWAGIGLDSTTTNSAQAASTGSSQIATAADTMELSTKYIGFPGVGLHTITALEWSGAVGTMTWYGGGGTQTNNASALIVQLPM